MEIIPNKLSILAVQRNKTVEQLIGEALAASNGNVARAASLLGISRQALSKRVSPKRAAAPAPTPGGART